MSNQKNLAAVGVFVIIGIILSVIGILALTSGGLFSQKMKAVTFFNETVTGLNVGAPTKFKGVVIGKVTQIGFQETPGSRESWIRVEVEIDVDETISLGATSNFDNQEEIAESIRQGLRANLATESMVTGVRFIELEYDYGAPDPVFFNEDLAFIEIPSTPSPLAGLAESMTEVVARVGAIDLPAITQDLMQLLDIAKRRAEALDMQGLSDQMKSTLQASERLFESKEIKNSLEALEETLESIEELAESLNGSTRPMIMHMDSAAVALNATLQATQGILENVEAMTSPESAFQYETQTAMKEMSEMARSLRFLADELERNPGSLLRGKSEEQQ